MIDPTIAPISVDTQEDGTRFYHFPGDRHYMSITTVLKEYNATALDKWKQRIGEGQARKIASYAATRGKNVHGLCESYIRGISDVQHIVEQCSFQEIHDFYKIREILDSHVDCIRGIEIPLYSDKLKLAGTSDLVASFNGIPSIIDFKTSSKEKLRRYIDHYMMQGAGYGMMLEHTYQLKVHQIVVIIVSGEGIQIFVEGIDANAERLLKYLDKTVDISA